jgi:LSD1 subclass zinc finger protein
MSQFNFGAFVLKDGIWIACQWVNTPPRIKCGACNRGTIAYEAGARRSKCSVCHRVIRYEERVAR